MTRTEHVEYAKRMEDEHRRQNSRIHELEVSVLQNNKLIVSVEKLALNMENMQKELVSQREEIDELKERDGKRWREAVSYVTITLIGAVIGYILKTIGI